MKKQSQFKKVVSAFWPMVMAMVGMGLLAETKDANLFRGVPTLLLTGLYAAVSLNAFPQILKQKMGRKVLTVLCIAFICLMTVENISGYSTGSAILGENGLLWGSGLGCTGYVRVMSVFDSAYRPDGAKMAAEIAAHVPVLWMLIASVRKSARVSTEKKNIEN